MLRPVTTAFGFGGLLILTGLCATGCGGEVRASAPDEEGDAGTVSDAGDFRDARTCRTAEGVRLCGGGCPSLGPTECPGVGCQPLLDRVTGAPLGGAVCVADLPVPIEHCGACRDGDVCVRVSGEGTICAPEALCQALTSRGLTRACRYADFSVYDGRALAVSQGAACPRYACGPGCGPCPLAPTDRCSGRSAQFGYGFCFSEFDRPPCDPTQPLPRACAGYACIAWTSSDAEDTTSRAYAFCDTPAPECGAGDGRLLCNAR